MTPLAVSIVESLLWALAGLGFVSAVTAVFVVIARCVASKLLDDDGSSLP